MDFGIIKLFVVIRSFPPPGCSEVSDEIFLMFLMKDDICLPIMEDISSAGMLSNMLHSQHDTKSKKHRETNYWRKMTPRTYFLMMRMTAWCPVTWPDQANSLCGTVLWLYVTSHSRGKRPSVL